MKLGFVAMLWLCAFVMLGPTPGAYARVLAHARALGPQARPLAAGVVTEYPIPLPAFSPYGITTGPDGALWFIGDGNEPGIGRVTTAGQFTMYPFAQQTTQNPMNITVGPDAALWFTGGPTSLGRITTSGQETLFPIFSRRQLGSITAGSADLWLIENLQVAGRIMRYTTDGKLVYSTLRVPGLAYTMVTGPDGARWYTLTFRSRGYINRVAVDGTTKSYPISSNPAQGSVLEGLTNGPDGALWFTNLLGKIGRITVSGKITEFKLPVGYYPGSSIASGPDGALWFTETAPNLTEAIGRITINGQLSSFRLPPHAQSYNLTAGPDGAMWFTDLGTNSVGRITTAASAAFTR